MTRVADPDLPAGTHPAVREHFDSVQKAVNNGRIEFPVSTSVPTHTPEGPIAQFVLTGGNTYLYYWNGSAWKGVQLTL